MNSIGDSEGHYICYVKEKDSGFWFLTNDNCEPKRVSIKEVSKYGIVVTFKKKMTLNVE